jgi:hypothetical protein
MANLYPVQVRPSADGDGVDFQLQIKGHNQHYRITSAALRYAFNVDPRTDDELLRAFNANFPEIAEVAVLDRRFPSHQVLELTEESFRG